MKSFRRTVTRAALAAAALAGLAGAQAASAAQLTISSLVPQSGFVGVTGPSNPLTDPTYDFAGQNYQQLTSLDSITLTLTVVDGDTDLGQFDFNNLTLALDGIDTGLLLNGFTAPQIVTLTLGPTAISNAQAILAALKADGQLVGSILDATPGDNMIGLPARLDTELSLVGTISDGGNGGPGPNPVPLPAAALVAPLGAACAARFARRFRRNPA
jgi:hypothetical protein